MLINRCVLWLQFVETNFDLGNNYTDVIAPQDVATYGGLCALASFDRSELKVRLFLICNDSDEFFWLKD
jgi:COP9 signalosome complex subunit 1